MRRETRINLIFIAIFVALIAPGAVILVRKKLQPSAARMDMPDPVRRQLPFMAPQETLDGVVRVIPPLTGQWLDGLVKKHAGQEAMLLRGHDPVMSSDRRLQLAAVESGQGGTMAHLIVWDAKREDSGARWNDRAVEASEAAEPIPEVVRRELVLMGFVKPPAEVRWLKVKLPADASGVLSIGGNEGPASSVNVFTSPYPASK